MDSSFREEMLRRIKTLEDQYLAFKKTVELAKRVERESRSEVFVPHLYEQAVNAGQQAIGIGVPPSVLEPIKNILDEYLSMVKRARN